MCVFTCSSSFDYIQTGSTALLVAAQEGHCEVVRMLLKAKADVNMKNDVSGSCSSDSVKCALDKSIVSCLYTVSAIEYKKCVCV